MSKDIGDDNEEMLLQFTESYEEFEPTKKEVKIGKRIIEVRHEYDKATQIFNLSEMHGQFVDVVSAYKKVNIDEVITIFFSITVKIKLKQLSQLLVFVGTDGKYQKVLILQAAIMSIAMSMILYSTSYIFATPDYYCGYELFLYLLVIIFIFLDLIISKQINVQKKNIAVIQIEILIILFILTMGGQKITV